MGALEPHPLLHYHGTNWGATVERGISREGRVFGTGILIVGQEGRGQHAGK